MSSQFNLQRALVVGRSSSSSPQCSNRTVALLLFNLIKMDDWVVPWPVVREVPGSIPGRGWGENLNDIFFLIETEFLAEFVTLLLDVSCLRGWTEVPRKSQSYMPLPRV